ncbi:hypothetical protein BIW11_10991 [Tropilaelaps mercedesae]|uniref:AAA+ ATPase domain-containing protein n=1 Tax=Tropilaelaps mercedesae TaxID=418985 RepID=A0A1V9XDD5_9ACAR|nr:hypothetical protein BIW11_10991 [Tropilaelaps mercedesae]
MNTPLQAQSGRIARRKKKRSTNSFQDTESSPELTTASAKRIKQSSPPNEDPRQSTASSQANVSKEISLTQSTEEATDDEVEMSTVDKTLTKISGNLLIKQNTIVPPDNAKACSGSATLKTSHPPQLTSYTGRRRHRPKRRRFRKAVINGESSSDDSVVLITQSPSPARRRCKRPQGTQQNPEYIEVNSDEESPPDDSFTHRDTWTLKYAPNMFGTFVGNEAAVEQLENWLREWQDPARNMKDFISSYNHEYTCSTVSQQEAASNAIFIKGPPGVGKTSLVYYAAHRLGYMVLEVNSSSERPGRRILADLQEATQSSHVEGTKVSTGKSISSFFKPTLSSAQTVFEPSTSPTSTSNRGKFGKSNKKTPAVHSKRTLQHFFSPKNSPTSSKADPVTDDTSTKCSPEVTTDMDGRITESKSVGIKAFFKPDKKTDGAETPRTAVPHVRSSLSPIVETGNLAAEGAVVNQKIKCSKNMIILFDDVDVIFEDEGDEGFWMALDTVVKNSKKPCILTATQDYESIVKRCRLLQNAPLLELHRPNPTEVAALVKRVCATENRDLTDYNVEFMCQYMASDVRRSLLQMEYETVSPGLTQTVYPANRTIGALLYLGYIDDVLTIQLAYKKVGFNALYASLQDCLPFNFEEESLDSAGERFNSALPPCRSLRKPETEADQSVDKAFKSATLKDLSEIFDELSACDLFTGALDRVGEECLPSYERAKRWMDRLPMEGQNKSLRLIEELLEIEAFVLLRKVVKPISRISERFRALAESQQRALSVLHVKITSGFHDIHRHLEKVRVCEKTLEDVLGTLPIPYFLARDYLAYLVRICKAEEIRKKHPRRSAHRFLHYLYLTGIFFSPEQLFRLTNFWQDKHA